MLLLLDNAECLARLAGRLKRELPDEEKWKEKDIDKRVGSWNLSMTIDERKESSVCVFKLPVMTLIIVNILYYKQ